MDDFENMTEFSPFTWQPVYSDGTSGELMDFNVIEHQSQLSSSRGILETIVEETSDDEENGLYNGKWSGSDSFSSGSSSETGSVVRVDLAQDQDAMSERDFICPPKRRRQELDQPKIDFVPTSSLFSQLLNVQTAAVSSDGGLFDNYFMKQNDLRYRFDELGVELFSDSDRLSYTSLSRSSSLIQFESLERQLQSDTQISGSSPSIYSYEGSNNISNGSTTHNQQEIISSEKSTPIAINLPTIKITSSAPVIQFTNSDSEPYSSDSTSSSYSSDDSVLLHQTSKKQEQIGIIGNDSSLSSNASSSDDGGAAKSNANTSMTKSIENRKKLLNSFRAKNSVDSLSEDSGYCDRDIRFPQSGTLSLDSSLPTGNDLEDEDGNVIEEKSISLIQNQTIEPEFAFAPLSRIRYHSSDDDICYHSMEHLNRKIKTYKMDLLSEMNIDSTAGLKLPNYKYKPKVTTKKLLKIDSSSDRAPSEHNTRVKNKNENSVEPQIQREKIISISSPELFTSDNSRKLRSKLKRGHRQHTTSCDQFKDIFSVHSVPDYINLLSLEPFSDRDLDFSCWNEQTESVASKNFNLYDLNYGPSSSVNNSTVNKQKVDISASCANLTLLNYSDDDPTDFGYENNKLKPINRANKTMSGKMSSGNFSSDDDDDAYIASYRSKELSSLLEEISAHFDKNLSILNDREATYEPQIAIKSVKIVDKVQPVAPMAPPRRTQIKTSPNHPTPPTIKATFDRDPTNLTTCYAQSLEKCNFNIDEPVNVYDSRQNLYLASGASISCNNKSDDLPLTTPIKKRNFVSSTPNLNYFDLPIRHMHHYSSTDNNAIVDDQHLSPSLTSTYDDDNRCVSMKEIPTTNSRSGSAGILLASHAGSKGGLSVSFCPIVSEISWQENPDDDDFSDEVDLDPSAGSDEHISNPNRRNDSLVNYYNHNDDDDDDEDFDDFHAVGTSCTSSKQPTQHNDHHVRLSPTHEKFEHLVCEQPPVINDNKTSTLTNEKTMKNNIETMESTITNLVVEPVSNKMLVESQTANSESLIAAEMASSSPKLVSPAGQVDVKVTQTSTTVPQKISTEPLVPKRKSLLSRLSSGLRFSFRNKKSKKNNNNGVVNYQIETNNNANGGSKKGDKFQNSVKSTATTVDGIFIPLKDPNDNVKNYDPQLANRSQNLQNRDNVGQQQQQQQQQRVSKRDSPPRSAGNQVMGKPPLPKLPPRIVGVSTKSPPQNQTTKRPATTHAPRASSTPRELDSGEYYGDKLNTNQIMIGDGLKQYYSGGSHTMGSDHKIGLIETNLDTDETVINGKTQSLMELGIGQNVGARGIINRIVGMGGVQVMQNGQTVSGNGANSETGRPHKSMEFLLDKENHQRVLPPENELQKARDSNVALSEHQLRVQASLQKLNIPDWYKQYSGTGHNTSVNTSYYKTADVTGLLRKRNSDVGRWQGLSSKTTSLSSLGSNRSDRSPVVLSPSAHSHHGGQTGFSRWSTSHLNSSQTSPSVSARSSFVRNTAYNASTMSGQSVTSAGGVSQQSNTIRNSFRQPYLGWRSQEKLSQAPRTPAERLASSLMTQKQSETQQKKSMDQPIATQEIQSSIKEVTSAIVHYVNDQTNRGSHSRSVSPSTRCWLESSFVGTKPLESPQTPALENSFVQSHKSVNIGPMSAKATNYETQIRLNGVAAGESTVI